MTGMGSCRLEVDLGGLIMKNPITVASGTFAAGREYSDFVDLARLGAVTTKGVSDVPWEGNASPRIAETCSGLLNSIGLQNPGVEAFCSGDLAWLAIQGVPIIVNVSGHSVEAYVKVIERAGKKGKTLDLISARSTLVFPNDSRRGAPFHRGDLFANHILHGQLATQRYAVRREFFASTDGWNIDLPGWNDWELGLRLLLASPRVAYLGGPSRVTINHNGADSITGTEFHSRHGQWERVIDIMRNEVLSSNLKAEHKLRFMRLLEYRRMVLAAQYEREGCSELAKPLCRQANQALEDSYHNNRRWRWLVAPVTRRLFARIASGKRGSARIARLLY